MSFSSRIGAYLRQQHLGLLALFLVVSGGTAVALTGSNTVFSDDIVNGEVRTSDLQDNGLRSADVRDDTVAGGGLTAADLRVGSVGGSEVALDALTGGDIDESTLGTVPAASLAGIGTATVNHAGCSPAGTTYVDCGYVTLNLPRTTRVLIAAAGTSDSPGSSLQGYCRLATSQASLEDTYAYIEDQSNWGLTTVTAATGPGNVDFGVECEKEGSNSVAYGEIQISAVLIGPS
jgi:hypothetical protein